MNRPLWIHEGKLLYSGEHLINALRMASTEQPSAWVSLFHTRFSPAGEGNVAQVARHRAGGNADGTAVVTAQPNQYNRFADHPSA